MRIAAIALIAALSSLAHAEEPSQPFWSDIKTPIDLFSPYAAMKEAGTFTSSLSESDIKEITNAALAGKSALLSTLDTFDADPYNILSALVVTLNQIPEQQSLVLLKAYVQASAADAIEQNRIRETIASANKTTTPSTGAPK